MNDRDEKDKRSSRNKRNKMDERDEKERELHLRCLELYCYPNWNRNPDMVTTQIQHLLFHTLRECFDLRNNMHTHNLHEVHAISIITEICYRHSGRVRAELLIRFCLLIMRLVIYKQTLCINKDIMSVIRNEEYNVDTSILNNIDVTSINICLQTTKSSDIKILLSIIHDAFIRELDDIFVDEDTLFRWCEVKSPDILEEKLSIPLVRLLFIAQHSTY